MIRLALRAVLMLATALLAGAAAALEPVSGYDFLVPETQAMQDDEFENPGMVTVDQGEALFREHREHEEYACASCHGDNGEKLDLEKIASYPRYNRNLGGLVTLQDQIGHCWEINMDRFPLMYDAPELVELETYVRNRAIGERINVQTDGPMQDLLQQGEALYQTRFGQIGMACQHCHVQHQGQMLRGQRLTQGQANGFPQYRLAKGEITSLHKRMRQCFISFRAEPFDPGAEEFKLLELYLMSRGNGLKIETPAVRF
ncbi:MAG TPA: sulfur oxidation c-type cytochrome SoxA [Gammaproteobacteria bacterium]|nr:sulfur oxidation c-type cytochrome SoxA [Gammaproteobacteria bacterium]